MTMDHISRFIRDKRMKRILIKDSLSNIGEISCIFYTSIYYHLKGTKRNKYDTFASLPNGRRLRVGGKNGNAFAR